MRRLILKLLKRRRMENDLEAELAFHREMAASREGSVPLGNTAAIKEQAYDLWRFNFIENLGRDLVYAVRGLRRSPALVAGALLSLSLGIGLNTTMFSLGVELLMSEPSVREPSSLVAMRVGGSSHAEPRTIDFIRDSGVFEGVAGHHEGAFVNWNDGTETRRVFGFVLSKNYFTLLGIPVEHGRGIVPADPDEVAVLNHDFWRRHFKGDTGVLGRSITLDGRPHTVVGVLPKNHRTVVGFGFTPDVFIPRHFDDTRLALYARLRPDTSFEQAVAAFRTVSARLDAAPPTPLWDANSSRIEPVGGLPRLKKQLVTVGLFFVALLVVVGLVLLIACINVAGLLLARASVRRREIAIRLSLGAGRARLLQQLLVESLVLSVTGTALGFVLAHAASSALASIHLPLPFPIRLRIEPDWRVATYAALLGIFSTVACGLLPAWRAVRESISSNLHRENRFRLRRVLVASQITVSVVVLATGILFVRSLLKSNQISPGFDVQRTIRADVHLPREKYAGAQGTAQFVDRAIASLQSIPGVDAVAGAQLLPFTDGSTRGTEIRFPDTGERRRVRFAWNAVTPAYFRAMDIPIHKGREFNATSMETVRQVAVNTTFVEQYLGGREPVGAVYTVDSELYQIVAVVGGTKTMTIGEDQAPQVYESFSQAAQDAQRVQFVLRSATPPVTQLNAVKQRLRALEPNAGAEVATLYSSIGLAFLPSQIGAALLGSTGLLGLILAGVGLYGTMLYTVARRTREIGVRMAIGASRGAISRMVLSETLRVVFTGSAAGLFIAVFVTRPLAMFLVPGLSSYDPLTLAATTLVLLATAVIASYGPVCRARKVDPMTSLRYE